MPWRSVVSLRSDLLLTRIVEKGHASHPWVSDSATLEHTLDVPLSGQGDCRYTPAFLAGLTPDLMASPNRGGGSEKPMRNGH